MVTVFSVIAVCAAIAAAAFFIMWMKKRESLYRKRSIVCLAIVLVSVGAITTCDSGENGSQSAEVTHVTYAPVEKTPVPTVPTPAAASEIGFDNGSSADAEQVSGKYVASKNSNKYHHPSCGSAENIIDENRIWFSSADEAAAQGYSPCGKCKP